MSNRSLPEIIICHGPISYRRMWSFQQDMNASVADGSGREILIFTEHLPVYTIGFHGNKDNMIAGVSTLRSQGVELIKTERGGDITFHGPGQLVVYPIIDLYSRNYGVRGYVERLEQSVIDTCSVFGIHAGRRDGAPGVWCGADGNWRKICAVGVKVRRGVTMHGLALNITTDLSWFGNINPCGFSSHEVTSVVKEIGSNAVPRIDEIIDVLMSNLLYSLWDIIK